MAAVSPYANLPASYNPFPDVAPSGYAYVNRPMGGQELVRIGGGYVSDFASMGITPYGAPETGGFNAAEQIRREAFTSTPTTGGGFQPKQPIGSVSTQRTTYAGQMPTLELRKMDKQRVASLRQKALAPRLRHLRQALNRALTRSYENPNVRRMIVRSALEGFGTGLESASAGAEQFALQQEAQERGTENQELVAAYNAALQNYRASGVTTTTTKNIYSGEEAATGETGKKRTLGIEGSGSVLPSGRVI